jgi:hypothetical protein
VPFLSALATRFHAAKLLMDIMGEDTNQIVSRSKELGVMRYGVLNRTPQLQKSVVEDRSGKTPEDRNRMRELEEAELLSCVSKMVDLRLSTDGST